MTLLLSAAAVGVLFAFLVWRARRNPLFLAGAAAFLGLGRSVFIDIIPDQAVPSVPLVKTGDLIFVALALGWLYARARRPVPRVRLSAGWIVLGAVLAAFLALELALAFSSADEMRPTLILMSRNWLYIPLGYLMMLDILRRFLMQETVEYVNAISVLTVCLTTLFVASALGVPIYPYPKSLSTSFQGTTIIRDFTTFPIWIGLAWAYYLSRPKKNGWVYVALTLLACGTMLSYTRTTIATLAVVAILAAVLLSVRRGRRRRALVIGAVGGILTLLIVVGAPVVMPAQYAYLQSRFAGLEQPNDVLLDPNAALRVSRFNDARDAGARVDSLFGSGLFDSSVAARGGRFDSYDGDWIRIVYRTGWAGVAVFGAPLIFALWWGVRAFLRSETATARGTLMLAGVLMTAVSLGGQLVGLVYFWWPALSLFSVALVAYASGVPIGAVDARVERPEHLAGQ